MPEDAFLRSLQWQLACVSTMILYCHVLSCHWLRLEHALCPSVRTYGFCVWSLIACIYNIAWRLRLWIWK
jgi:hypothetical protein